MDVFCSGYPTLCYISSKDKKAMLSFTTGAAPTMFQPDGINGDINVTLWPLQVRHLRNKLKTKTKNSQLTTSKVNYIINWHAQLCSKMRSQNIKATS